MFDGRPDAAPMRTDRPLGAGIQAVRFATGPTCPIPDVAAVLPSAALMVCVTLRDALAEIDGRGLSIVRGDSLVLAASKLATLTTAAPVYWIGLVIPQFDLIDRLAGASIDPPMVAPREILSARHLRTCLLCLWRSGASDTLTDVKETVVDLLVAALDQHTQNPRTADEAKLQQVLQVSRHLREGLHDPAFDAEQLAERSDLTPKALAALLTPLRPTEIIRSARLAAAKRLLHSAAGVRLSVAAIGYRVGMTNLAHFSTSYRNAFGAPPTAGRRAC